MGVSEKGPVIDGCAGPGGWDLAARAFGIDPLGIEWDDAACATRAVAGLRTVQADVVALDPVEFMAEHFDGAELWGEIFSPPCPSFSRAGKGQGRSAIPLYCEAMERMAFEGGGVDRAELDEICEDERAHLILEPLRWALALMPRWVALEQVRPCLPLWECTAKCLRHHGYQTWTGICSAERYGVPQTRERAILLASLDGPVAEPRPTHQRYVAPRKVAEATGSLFEAPEPERIVLTEDRELLPWVSMAQALGWGLSARPSTTVMGRDAESGGANPLIGGSGGKAVYDSAQDAGEWVPSDVVGFPACPPTASNRATGRVRIGEKDYRERDLRPASQPAFALTEKSRSWVRFRSNAQPNASERSADEPAPTITGGHDHGERQWIVDTGDTRSGSQNGGRVREAAEPAPPLTTRADQLEWREDEPDTRPVVRTNNSTKGGTRDGLSRSVDEPSRTVDSKTSDWTVERPATTVAGDPRIFPPGHKINAEDVAAGRGGQQRSGAGWTNGRPATAVTGTRRSEDGGTMRAPSCERPERGGEAQAVRVTLEEALVLQDFPPTYPVQGSKTKRFEQVGNAIPPGLARAVLAVVVR